MKEKDNISLTNLKLLNILKDGRLEIRLSDIAELLYPNGRCSRRAQGMTLAGANAVNNAIKKGLVERSIGIDHYIFRLTNKGYEVLRQSHETTFKQNIVEIM